MEETSKKKPMKWYFVALITLAVAAGVAYLFWPKSCVDMKADVKYDPKTGEKLDPAAVTTNPVSGQKYTA